jgi:carbon-monoxide dehydrogenase medium subunit
MQVSRYEAPESLNAAIALLANDNEARVIAGGTDLLVQMRTGGEAPSAFIDIKRIPEMSRLEITSSGLVIGATVPAAKIYANDTIRQLWPGLAEATDLIGSSQIQGRATWGGNLCNASPAADSVPALIATGAEVIVLGPNGERKLPVDGFVTGPGQTVLEPGELVVAFRVPAPAPRSADAYLRMIPRTEMDIAVVGAAVQLTLDADGSVASAVVVLGAVAPTQLRVDAAAAALVGSKLEDAALSAAASAASEAANPIDDKRGTIVYRKKISGVLTKRAARIAYDRAKERN